MRQRGMKKRLGLVNQHYPGITSNNLRNDTGEGPNAITGLFNRLRAFVEGQSLGMKPPFMGRTLGGSLRKAHSEVAQMSRINDEILSESFIHNTTNFLPLGVIPKQ